MSHNECRSIFFLWHHPRLACLASPVPLFWLCSRYVSRFPFDWTGCRNVKTVPRVAVRGVQVKLKLHDHTRWVLDGTKRYSVGCCSLNPPFRHPHRTNQCGINRCGSRGKTVRSGTETRVLSCWTLATRCTANQRSDRAVRLQLCTVAALL